jgi:hypothetical protein
LQSRLHPDQNDSSIGRLQETGESDMAKKEKSNQSAFKTKNKCPKILEINPKVVKCKDLKCKKKGAKKITFDVHFSITPDPESTHVPLTFKDKKLSFRVRPALCGGILQLKLTRLECSDSDPDKEPTIGEKKKSENKLKPEENKSSKNKKKTTVEFKIPYFLRIIWEYETGGNTQDRENTPLFYRAGTSTEPCWVFYAPTNCILKGPCKPAIKTRRIGTAGPCKFSYEFHTTNMGDWVVEPDIRRLPFSNPIKRLMARLVVRNACEKAASSYYSKHSIPSKGDWICPIGRKKSTTKH